MKKRILLVLTLLVAFFGFMGLSISNKQVDVYAAGDQSSVESDLQVVLNNIPERAILSFPVTYESVYGNEISFAVEENQSAITYDAVAHWMVVDRANADTVTITVTVTGEGEAVATGTKDVTVPEGVTTTRSFAISYNYGYENPTELDNPKTSYKLGEASFDLATPIRYGYKFAGWYENEQYTGEPISKVLVGSMKDYTLYAKWTTMGFDANHVSFAEELDYTYDGQAKTPTMNVSNPYEDGNLVLGTDYQVSYNNNTNAGTDTATVTVTGIGEYAGSSVTKTFSIAKKELTLEIDSLSKYYGDDDPTYTYSQTGLVNGESLDMTGFSREEGQDVKDGGYKISYDALKMPNYTITANDDAVLTINPIELSVNLTSDEPKVYNLGITPTWSLNEFTITGWKYQDTVSVLGGSIVATYYQNGEVAELNAAGTYDVVFSGLTSNNYTFAYGDGQIEVIVADVTFTAKSYTYNSTEQTLEVIAKDSENNEIDSQYLTYTNNKGTNAGNYSVNVTLNHPTHGQVQQSVTVTIEKAELTIIANHQTIVYGEEKPASKLSYFNVTNLQVNDSVQESWISGTIGNNVGTYTLTIDTSTLENNYIVGGVNQSTLEITKATLTVTPVNNITKTYGDLDPAKSDYFTISGLTNGDEFNDEWVSRVDGEDVGSYTVTLSTSALSQNYIISGSTTNTLTITRKTINVTIKSISKTYGESDPTWDYEALALVDGDSFDESGFSRVSGEDVGTYAITYTQGNLMPNYTVTANNDAVLTINQLDLSDLVTVTYNTMDANTQQGTYAVVPTVMYGETSITSFTTTYTYEDEETKLGNATLTITFSGNYTGTYTYNYVVTAKPKALEDGQVIAAAMAQVSTVSNGQTLPTVQYGSSINWISNNTGVTVVDGKVVINEVLLNGTTVTLTAYINFEDSSDVQQFTVNVETSKQTIYDETTKVTIEEVPGNLDVTVEDVKESQDSSNYIVEGEDLLGAYDITFSDKESQTEVKNPGTVIVKLPAPEGYESSDLTVYHILDNENRVSVEFDYVVEDEKGYLVFEADSFSPYVVVSLKKYTIKWSINDTVVEIDEVKHGVTPEYNGADPSKEKDQQYTYTFNGWSPVVSAATSDIIYVAQFATTTNKYTITWKNGDEVLDTDEVEYGAMPEYNGEIPTKTEDENYTYEFAGWTPEITEVTNSVEYHAVFNNVEKENNNVEIEIEQWELVTDATTLQVGDQIIIVAKDFNYALSTNQKDNNRGHASINKLDNIVTFGDDVQIITLENGTNDGTFAFKVNDNKYLCAASSSSNYLRSYEELDDNGSWLITIIDGVTNVVAQGEYTRNTLKYNNSSSLFSCYSSGQQDIVIYKYIHTITSVPKEQCATVTFNYDNGTESKSVIVMKGKTIAEEEAPVKDGYRFLGWLLNGETYDFNTAVNDDIELVAGWKQIIMSDINYEEDCGVLPEGSPTQYEEGIGLDELPVPTKDGYVFDGWYIDEEKVESISAEQTGDVVLTAKWVDSSTPTLTEKTYSYTFAATQFTANGTKTLEGVNWTLAGDGGYWGLDGNGKGQQFGSGSKPYKTLTLTSTSFNNVKSVTINTSGASSVNASFTVKVNGVQIGSSTTLTTTATEYTFTCDNPITGIVEFNYTQTSSKALYIKSITIEYAE